MHNDLNFCMWLENIWNVNFSKIEMYTQSFLPLIQKNICKPGAKYCYLVKSVQVLVYVV